MPRSAFASVDDAQSFALQAAEPYVKDGFQVREDFWGGDLGAGEKKAVKQQLFKGNEYWFWLATRSHARFRARYRAATRRFSSCAVGNRVV